MSVCINLSVSGLRCKAWRHQVLGLTWVPNALNVAFCSDKWPDHRQVHLDVPRRWWWMTLEYRFHISQAGLERWEKYRSAREEHQQDRPGSLARSAALINMSWSGSPPLLFQPVQSGVRQRKALPRPAPAYLLSFLRKIPSTSTIVSRESTSQTRESIPSGGGRAILESPVNPSEGWASGQGLHRELTWP